MKFSFSGALLKRYIISFFIALLVSVLISAICGMLFSFTNPSPNVISVIKNGISFLPIFIAAFLCAKSTGKNGLLTGIICGNILMLIIIVTGMLVLKNSFPAAAVLKIFSISTALGAAGGILGINFNK